MTTPKPVALPAWDRLMDSDWVNIVNAQSVKDEGSYTHGAVCEAVKLCEARLRELNEPQIASALSAIAMHRAEVERLREALDEAVRRADELSTKLAEQAISEYSDTLKAMDEMKERCARAVEALRDDHCASTAVGDAGYDACSIDSPECEFVVAWNDAAAAIRSLSSTTGATKDQA